MEDRRITKDEQMCIAECIRTYWGKDSENTDPEIKEKRYEECVTNCEVCG